MIRKISLTDHPSNIAVFTASCMAEALDQADKAITISRKRGAIWFKEHTAYTLPMGKIPSRETFHAHAVQYTNDLSAMGRTKFFPRNKLVDDMRLKNLEALTDIFNTVQLQIRTEYKNSGRPHVDNPETPFTKNENTSWFNGDDVRILCAREKIGTMIYDGREGRSVNNVPNKPWEVPCGSYLFFLPTTDDRKLRLWHSKPSFLGAPLLTRPRILDVYDCIHR